MSPLLFFRYKAQTALTSAPLMYVVRAYNTIFSMLFYNTLVRQKLNTHNYHSRRYSIHTSYEIYTVEIDIGFSFENLRILFLERGFYATKPL
jgi:hypothetical protein